MGIKMLSINTFEVENRNTWHTIRERTLTNWYTKNTAVAAATGAEKAAEDPRTHTNGSLIPFTTHVRCTPRSGHD
jgi:hypothetical protein